MGTKNAWNANTKRWRPEEDWPVIREKKRKGGKVAYMVDTCRRLPTRERKTYKTLEEAQVACEMYHTQLKGQGTKGFELTPSEREDAYSALEICQELGISSLTAALDLLRPHYAPPAGTVTIRELRKEYLEFYKAKVEKGRRSQRQFQTLKDRTNQLVPKFGRKPAKEISARGLWDWLSGMSKEREWARNTLKGYCDAIGQLFEFGRNKGYLAANPLKAHEIQFEKEEALEQSAQKAPAILTIEQASALLAVAHAENSNRGLLGFVSICLFTGARPEAEAAKLAWDDIDLEDGRIYIRPNKNKNTASARSMEICSALMGWLLLCDRNKPLIPPALAYRWKKTRAAVRLPNVGDLTRHSFASYSYCLHGQKSRLIDETGHVGDQMLKYYLGIRPEIRRNAKTYFGLTPRVVLGTAEKVAQMGAVN